MKQVSSRSESHASVNGWKILALDYGRKRIGVAACDTDLLIALPVATIDTAQGLCFLKKYLTENRVQTLVMGYPITLKGQECDLVRDIRAFVTTVKTTFPELLVEYIDERFTSKIASQVIVMSALPRSKRQDKKRLDVISATLILQCWIARKSRNKE